MNKHFSDTGSEPFLSEQQRMVRNTARQLDGMSLPQLQPSVIAPRRGRLRGAESSRRPGFHRHDRLRGIRRLGIWLFSPIVSPSRNFPPPTAESERSSTFTISAQLMSLRKTALPSKSNMLPALASGDKIGAFLITEPQAQFETSALRTSARRDGDDFVINGTKQFISNGSEAGVAIIVARTDRGAGKRGFTTFLVEPPAKGLHSQSH